MKNIFKYKDTIIKFLNRKEFWFGLICFGLIIKLLMFPIKLGDYNFYLKPWIDFIKNHGYYTSLKYDFYNYTPSYIYILIALAKIGFNPLYSIKIVSVLFEYILAFIIGKIVCLKYKNNLNILISIAVIPLLPTILLNGAYWGQCDSIYSTFVIASIYFILRKNQFISVLFLGLAFAFKVQTAFILPFYFLLLLRGNIKWYYFSLIPLIYFISILPAWFYGRPLIDLISIYASQSGYYQGLTIFFPNIYVLVSDNYFESGRLIGLLLTTSVTLFSGIYLSRKRYLFTFDIWIKLAFLSVIIIPFILPEMHERYLYLGDVVAVLYFLVFRKNLHLSLGILLVSFYAYISCSRFKNFLPLWPAFIIYLTVIIFAIKDFIISLEKESNQTQDKLSNGIE